MLVSNASSVDMQTPCLEARGGLPRDWRQVIGFGDQRQSLQAQASVATIWHDLRLDIRFCLHHDRGIVRVGVQRYCRLRPLAGEYP